MEERRASPFTEKLSMFMVGVAALGAFVVLLDIKYTVTIGGAVIQIGSDGFSADLKGAVISAILIGGWTAVKEYWLGASVGSVKSAESMQRIAEKAPEVAAAVVAASAPAAVTPAPVNPETGVVPAAEVAPPKETKP